MGRHKKDHADRDTTVYQVVSEVHTLADCGKSDDEIAEMLSIEVQEVRRIRDDPLGYQRAKGVEPKGVVILPGGCPTPEEIDSRRAIEWQHHLRKRLAETSTHYNYGANKSEKAPTASRPRTRRGY